MYMLFFHVYAESLTWSKNTALSALPILYFILIN